MNIYFWPDDLVFGPINDLYAIEAHIWYQQIYIFNESKHMDIHHPINHTWYICVFFIAVLLFVSAMYDIYDVEIS